MRTECEKRSVGALPGCGRHLEEGGKGRGSQPQVAGRVSAHPAAVAGPGGRQQSPGAGLSSGESVAAACLTHGNKFLGSNTWKGRPLAVVHAFGKLSRHQECTLLRHETKTCYCW